jgi:purine-nucleoside phosphorylase
MIIKDHINNFGVNPLMGPCEEEFGVERFPDMTDIYSKELRNKIEDTMRK